MGKVMFYWEDKTFRPTQAVQIDRHVCFSLFLKISSTIEKLFMLPFADRRELRKQINGKSSLLSREIGYRLPVGSK